MEDEDTEDPKEVKENTKKNQHISDDEEDDDDSNSQ